MLFSKKLSGKHSFPYFLVFIPIFLFLLGAVVFKLNGLTKPATNLSKIKHIVIIMQENRSFDSYFGTFPGANGIPMKNGKPTVCVPNPKTGECVQPYHDTNDVNGGGPIGPFNTKKDVNGGKMDGFIAQAQIDLNGGCYNIICPPVKATDVMGYHTDKEIPNYWSYAKNFVLQDAMFESVDSWSLPKHLYMVSEWSATCAKKGYIDHQVLSHDTYNKFIEDVFLDGERLDPKTDGKPDPRPDVRENSKQLGDILNDLDLTQAPLPPMLLLEHPKTDFTN